MKFKTTKKAINNGYAKVISIGYCNLQHLLCCEEPIAYTVRREGHASDVYTFGNVAITTGYAPFGNVHPDYEIQHKYETMAENICREVWDYQKRKPKLRVLIYEFLDEVLGQEDN